LQNGRYYSHLNTAEKLVVQYQGELPLHHFLKSYFREHTKYGSRDRKQISRLCYAYFRTGGAWKDIDVKDKILASLFLTQDEPDDLLMALKPEWKDHVELHLSEKLSFLEHSDLRLPVNEVFPLYDHISPLLAGRDEFILSHFVQPRLFLRIRPGKEELVEGQLRTARIPYNIYDQTVELANSTDIAPVMATDRDVVVQDLSSQHTGKLVANALELAGKGAKVWDCCAASGGKSIMALDLDPSIDLAVSDIRPAILHNLSGRFERAGIKKYRSFVADLSTEKRRSELYDVIIADVPCSGSGTWGRTPEELYFFSSAKLERYQSLQKKIVKNIESNIRPGGVLLYFTCSVFRDENEDMVEYIQKNTKLELRSMEIVSGWESRADTMFMSMFTLPA
jgi:16S rRNA (cytosine967-C5)-methyltransferase